MSVKKDLWRKNLPYFDPIYFNDDKVIAIACPTEQDAIALFDILDEYGYEWAGGENLRNDNTNWVNHGKDTCYYLNYPHVQKMCIVYGNSEDNKTNQWYQFSASYIPQSCNVDIMDMI